MPVWYWGWSDNHCERFPRGFNTFLSPLASPSQAIKHSLCPIAGAASYMVTIHTSPLILPDFWVVIALATGINIRLGVHSGGSL
jgi:hypothetical protein